MHDIVSGAGVYSKLLNSTDLAWEINHFKAAKEGFSSYVYIILPLTQTGVYREPHGSLAD